MQFVVGETLVVVILLSQFANAGTEERNLTVLRILGLFPFQGSFWNGEYVIPAARLARDEINKNDSVLPGFQLELIEANSGCNRDDGVLEFVANTLHCSRERTPVAVLGAGCSSSTIPVAAIAGRNDIRIPQVSYGATSPFLSFPSSYPYFFRAVSSDGSASKAVVSILDKFNWKRYGIHKIGIDGVSELWIDHFIHALRTSILHHISGADEVYSSSSNHESAVFEDYIKLIDVNSIRSSSMRIGILFAAERGKAGDFMCYLHRQKLVYPRIIWILVDICQIVLSNSSTSSYCNGKEELQQAIAGSICLGYQLTTDDTISVTGKSFDQFNESYMSESIKYAAEKGDNFSISLLNDWATVGYDSMWTLGLALHNAERRLLQYNSSLTAFSLGSYNISETITEELSKIYFMGASGEVSFNDVRERRLGITFSQIQENGLLKIVGLYHPSHNSSDIGNLSIYASALSNNLLSDKFPRETVSAQLWAVIMMLIFLVIGFLWNSLSTYVNIRYQYYCVIKASSPQLNYMIFAGNYLLLLSGVVVVIRATTELDIIIFSTLCQTAHWLFDLGLLLILNITLLKSWRIYRLFYSFKRKPKWLITDNSIIGVSFGWILVNTLYHIVFTLVNNNNIAKEEFLPRDDDRLYQQVEVYCQYPNLVKGIFYIPHFVMAIILCLLAFLVHRVYRKHFNNTKYKRFNDAKYIAIFFYATIPIASICLVLSMLLSPVNEVYNLTTVSLMLECTAVLCVVYMCQLTLFVPKVLAVVRNFYFHKPNKTNNIL